MKKYNVIVVFDKEFKKTLMCKRTKEPYQGMYNLVGGKIEKDNDGLNEAYRELGEETGETKATIERPLWFTEYFFNFDNKIQHQYILGYLVNIPADSKLLESEEFNGIEPGKDIIYKWIDKKDIKDSPIKPDFLKEKLTNIKDTYEHIVENDL